MENLELVDQDSFELNDIFNCGQCFRWNKISGNNYIGVIKNTVLKVEKKNNKISFTGICKEGNFNDIIYDYFDLNRDYNELKTKLGRIDKYLAESVEFGKGIRILRQDLWETIISFIISANNNIPRIKKIIERLSLNYGKKIEFEDKEYYLFPTPEELSKATIEDLRNLGLGFRDKRVYEVTRKVVSGEINLDHLKEIKNTDLLREELLKLDGVGPKVADCILLFGFNRFDVFPVDVWVRRVMNDLYIHNIDENKVNKNEIIKIAKDKFGDLSGLAQQYLFYWKRENN